MKAATYHANGVRAHVAISIHAAREGGDHLVPKRHGTAKISIHAAREGGDVYIQGFRFSFAISIHAAREGGD